MSSHLAMLCMGQACSFARCSLLSNGDYASSFLQSSSDAQFTLEVRICLVDPIPSELCIMDIEHIDRCWHGMYQAGSHSPAFNLENMLMFADLMNTSFSGYSAQRNNRLKATRTELFFLQVFALHFAYA